MKAKRFGLLPEGIQYSVINRIYFMYHPRLLCKEISISIIYNIIIYIDITSLASFSVFKEINWLLSTDYFVGILFADFRRGGQSKNREPFGEPCFGIFRLRISHKNFSILFNTILLASSNTFTTFAVQAIIMRTRR